MRRATPCKATAAMVAHQKRADEASHIADVQGAGGWRNGYWRENAQRHYRAALNAALIIHPANVLPSHDDVDRFARYPG